jgi:hypothetical protein
VEENLHPWVWDMETGEKYIYTTEGNVKTLELELPRATSILIVFEKNAEGEPYNLLKYYTKGEEVTGGWNLQLNHMNGEKQSIELETLSDLVKGNNTKNFAGQIIYEKSIMIGSKDYGYIDLGDVQGVSELTMNGQLVGARWYGSHIYNIKTALKEGENEVSIKLTTIVGNYLKGLKDNPVAQKWTRHQDYYPMGIIGPIKLI